MPCVQWNFITHFKYLQIGSFGYNSISECYEIKWRANSKVVTYVYDFLNNSHEFLRFC